MRPELEIRPDDHVQGSAQAPLTLLAYGDYDCSYCGQAYYEIQEARRTLGPALRFAFRNLPLTELHPSALAAAQVAEAAALQGNSGGCTKASTSSSRSCRPRISSSSRRSWISTCFGSRTTWRAPGSSGASSAI